MRLATALSLTLALGMSLSACHSDSKDAGTPDADSVGSRGQQAGSGSRAGTEDADGAVKDTGGSVAPGAGFGTYGSAGPDGAMASGGAGGASFQGGSGGSTGTGTVRDGGVASADAEGGSIRAGADGSALAGTGGAPGLGGAGGSSSSSGLSGDSHCACVGTEVECLCRFQSYYCMPSVSDFTSGTVQYNTMVEYADCNLTVVETGGSSGKEVLIYDRSTGGLVGRRHYSDIVEPCFGSRVISGGFWPSASCRKTKCTEGPWGQGACATVPDRWDGRYAN